YNNSIPSSLEEIILKVLSKEPSSRYRTADQMGRLLLGLYDTSTEPRQNMAFVHDTFQGSRLVQPPASAEQAQVGAFQPPAAAGEYSRQAGNSQSTGRPEVARLPLTLVEEAYQYDHEEEWAEETAVDWKTWALAIIAGGLLVGLIPFWFYIYILLKP
ncbi:MAG TPA: hypothetical protein VFC66_04635, partial [Anaerolineaceae bacterium]|nr:hypothetical protein [Anaerolineaceae bacterium]